MPFFRVPFSPIFSRTVYQKGEIFWSRLSKHFKRGNFVIQIVIKSLFDFCCCKFLGHVHTSPFSFRSVFTRKNAANFPPCSHYSVFR